MKTDGEAVRAQQREFNRVSDEILSVKRKLKHYQELLDEAWKDAGIREIDFCMEEVIRRLNRLAGELEALGHDIAAVNEEEEVISYSKRKS